MRLLLRARCEAWRHSRRQSRRRWLLGVATLLLMGMNPQCAAPIPPTALLPLLDPAFPAHLCGSWHSDYAALHSRIRTASVAQYAATSTAASHTADGADAGVTGEAGGREDTPVAAAAPLSAPLPSTNSSSTSPTGPPPLRFLTYDWLDQCGGLGDSLVGLATSFAVALLDDRAFLIRHACLPWAFQPALVDWTLSPDVPLSPARTILRDKLSEKKQWEEWQGEVQPGEVLLLDLLNRNANPDWFFLGGKGEGKAGGKTGGKVGGLSRNAVNVRVRWNRGMLTRMLAGPWTAGRARRLYGMGMRLPYAFGCILRFLFKPNQEVWARVQAVQQQLVAGLETGSDAGPLVTIGLHIRVPDADVAWQEEHVRQKTQGEGGDSAGTATAEEVATGNVTMTNVTMANAAMGAEEQAAWMKAVWKWLACAEAVESFWLSPSLSVRWLLVTNSARLKLALKGKYPHKVVTSSIIPRHSNLLHTNQLDTVTVRKLRDLPAGSPSTSVRTSPARNKESEPLIGHGLSPLGRASVTAGRKLTENKSEPASDTGTVLEGAAAGAVAASAATAAGSEAEGREAFLDIVADWLVLAGCNAHVLSQSGFSASAAFYSLHPTNAFLPDKCVPETPLHADALGRLRSGV